MALQGILSSLLRELQLGKRVLVAKEDNRDVKEELALLCAELRACPGCEHVISSSASCVVEIKRQGIVSVANVLLRFYWCSCVQSAVAWTPSLPVLSTSTESSASGAHTSRVSLPQYLVGIFSSIDSQFLEFTELQAHGFEVDAFVDDKGSMLLVLSPAQLDMTAAGYPRSHMIADVDSIRQQLQARNIYPAALVAAVHVAGELDFLDREFPGQRDVLGELLRMHESKSSQTARLCPICEAQQHAEEPAGAAPGDVAEEQSGAVQRALAAMEDPDLDLDLTKAHTKPEHAPGAIDSNEAAGYPRWYDGRDSGQPYTGQAYKHEQQEQEQAQGDEEFIRVLIGIGSVALCGWFGYKLFRLAFH